MACLLRFSAPWFAVGIASVVVAAPGREVDYQRHIRPIFAEHCVVCHGEDTRESGLRLDQRGALLRGGDSGVAALVPGDAEASYLVRVLRGEIDQLQMPPDGPPLSEEAIARIERWIDQGADWPGQMDDTADRLESDHWSLQDLAETTPPTETTGQSHPLDAYIAQKLSEQGLALSPPADPRVLVRRVALTLTGLPPTPEQIDQVVSDPAGFDVAYERWIDELLASPRYGERWAQHWLDVIRWAETVGFETNLERPRAWPYRDWVIQAFNDDLPYDEFIYAQLAGDTIEEDAALGFLVAGPANLPGQIGRDEESMRQARQDELDEVIRTVGQAFFGLTIGCARCHNHKFDPILARDYYSMQAIFAGLTYGERRFRGEENDAWAAKVPAATERAATLRSKLETLRQQHQLRPPLEDLQVETFAPVTARAVRMEIRATSDGSAASLYELEVWTAGQPGEPPRNVALAEAGGRSDASSFALQNQTRHHENLIDGDRDRRQAFPWIAAAGGPAWVQIDLAEPATIERIVWDRGNAVPADYGLRLLPVDSETWQTVAATDDRMLREDDRRAADAVQLRGLSKVEIAELVSVVAQTRDAAAELARLSAGPQVYAARFNETPAPTYLLRRGDPMQRDSVVPPEVPTVFGRLGLSVDHPEVDRRVQLAQFLANQGKALTARVMVNRIWQKHFGRGLVDTPSDFGKKGAAPTHPELLDYLAAEFIEGDWSIKQLHRKIVTSKTFRQASFPVEKALAVDAESRLLWRFPPRRLEAEAIRDSILQAAGKVNLKMGGPGFSFFNQRGGLSDYVDRETFDEAGWRRMIYAHKIRMQTVDVFGVFDCPDGGQMQPKRTRSITPVQALGLLNSPFMLRQAQFFAARVAEDRGSELLDQIDRAVRVAYGRSPTPDEQATLAALAQEHGMAHVCRTLLNTSEFLSIR